MRRLSLSRLLTGVNVGLVLVAVVCVLAAAVRRLERLNERQALARVALAGTGARQAVAREGDELLIAARLLAERPTLVRLLEQKDSEQVASFLDQFRRTSGADGCAVILQGKLYARAGRPAAWEEMASRRSGADRFLLPGAPGAPMILGAAADVRPVPGAVAITARVLDDAFVQRIADEVRLPVRILPRSEGSFIKEDPQADLRARALDNATALTERVDAAGIYLCVVPLGSSAGDAVGTVEAALPVTGIAAALRGIERSLLLISIAVLGAAALLGLMVARWIARPLETLTASASRIGRGDLSTPIPAAAGLEAAALARSMEEMRSRLQHLTSELRRRQAEAEAVLTGIVEGVFAVDRERRVRYMNPQAAAMLGVSAEQAVGRFCGDLLNPQGPAGVRPCEEHCPIVHARFRGSARATEKLLAPDGRRVTVVITSAASGEESPGGAVDTLRDGRQFQVIRDETEMEATRRLRDVVLANISHEFKTPLTAQLASLELLRERIGDEESPETGMLVLSLQRGALRLTHLIDNLLESVRIETGQLSIRRRSVAVDEVVEEAVELTAPLIAQRRQALSIDLPYPLPPITGDPARLTQVFVNLLANANKFAPEGSTITIGGEVTDAEVTTWVADEGPGFPEGQGASIFERFVRAPGADDEEEPEQSGMGLGLSIVSSIVERHGGRVETRDGTPASAGTRVCVILPRERSHEDPGG